jgi:Lar family restriction alleviation protein
MSEKLKPCPFCGNKEQSMFSIYRFYNVKFRRINCDICGSNGAIGKNIKEAIAAWNKRVKES